MRADAVRIRLPRPGSFAVARGGAGARAGAGPGGEARRVTAAERERLLDTACAVVEELGYRGLTVRALSQRAGISRAVFYELFRNREDCLLAAFDRGVDGLAFAATPAWRAEPRWETRMRACLAVLLGCLDEDPALARLVFVEALAAGPRVLARRALVLGELAQAIDGGRAGHAAPQQIPPLSAEATVGAVFGLIHARLCDPRAETPLADLLNPLMAMIVLPYRGHPAAGRELTRPATGNARRSQGGAGL